MNPVNVLRKIRDQLLLWANRSGVPVDIQYQKKWYEQMANDETFAYDHDTVASILIDEFQPESVIDFGCGVGHTLAGFERRGVTIQGIEGSNVARELAVIDSSKIEVSDLRKPAKFGEYDLVVCMEVAEHLPEASADTLVDTVIAHGETIVFTAATPGQGGTNHHNEQPRDYWIQKFNERDYSYCSELTDSLAAKMEPKLEKAKWIPDNLFVFTC